MRRLSLALVIAFALPLGSIGVDAQESRLPDIGSSAGQLLTPARQAEYGKLMMAELRNYGYVLEDPLLQGWLQTIGERLAANSDQPQQSFTFILLKERQINAFATLGGYVAVNSGLLLTAEREDEVAAVLSHEIAHITQQHVLRSVERAQRDQIPILLGMLAAVIAAQHVGGNSSGDATMAGITSAMGLMQQRQINYTRSNEAEADRLGIRTLARSGYDVEAMAGFFERMSLAMRGNSGGDQVPDYLQTHPVTVTRISEAKARAEQFKKQTELTMASSVPGLMSQERLGLNHVLPGVASNPLLPRGLQPAYGVLSRGPSGQFGWAKERLRVLSAKSPDIALREYEALRRNAKGGLSEFQRYGLALAKLRSGSNLAEVMHEFRALLEVHPDNVWLGLALAQTQARTGQRREAGERFDALLRRFPGKRAVVLMYAEMLNEGGNLQDGKRAQALLLPLLRQLAGDALFQQTFARACELAGATARASEAYAEAAFLNGRPEQALIQLQALKKQNLDYVTRARVDARIAVITPTVLEMRRQGVRDPDLDR
ncbi:M48 family metallopeptidase [Xylella taiwanensis]|uniref:Putative beta-barrel assembly-enhancing protease n=1 Tax=Xylella taiwanensis TaxID=1444770 RepID=Z9JH26_9GAMM|nr:M48 family metalloprotease [Xylella taiwanensis]AXI84285.1 peptidase [Xylella taiwanensis]EWS77715.1 peptidase [Xylella taiwanensis]MCD8457400.1 M48 family metalloprotease [Xylella taiwanensis]MCD8457558.1 M48 family metalloprotease [Xylella taiwanensis]MCD8461318.1 M48 family metalloprotease [Xylella taiwanensis]